MPGHDGVVAGARRVRSCRAEWVEKAGHDLALDDHDLEHEVFPVANVGVGYTLQLDLSHLSAPAGDHGEFERHVRERSHLVDGFPGFLYLQLLRPQAGSSTHTFLSAWESRR